MMSWLTWEAIKLFTKKAWIWSKHHWKIVALVVWTIVIWFVSRKNARSMLKVLETTRQSYEDEISALNETHEKEIEKIELSIKDYQRVISDLDKNYKEQTGKLTFEKRERVQQLMDMHYHDKEAFSEAIEEEFGFKYVE
jgi:uncharacterized membrane protein